MHTSFQLSGVRSKIGHRSPDSRQNSADHFAANAVSQNPTTRALMRSRGSSDDGQTIVELAFTITVCLLLCLGVLDIARLFGTAESMENAVHEGAKVAAEYYTNYGANSSGLASYVKSQIAQEGLIDANNITNMQITTQTPSPTDYPGEQIVQVTFQYRYTFYGPWGMVPGFSNPFTMPSVTSAEATR